MNDANYDLELERYELFEDPSYNFGFDRRQFLKAFSGGIALIVPMSNLIARTFQQDQDESGRGRSKSNAYRTTSAHGYISTKSGVVSVFTGKVEIRSEHSHVVGPGSR